MWWAQNQLYTFPWLLWQDDIPTALLVVVLLLLFLLLLALQPHQECLIHIAAPSMAWTGTSVGGQRCTDP